MKYEYKNKKGKILEREFSMNGDIPSFIEIKGDRYSRVWSVPLFSISTKSSNYLKKDMDDFSRCEISKGSVEIKDEKCGKVKAQLRVDKDGKPEMVYKSNPTQVINTKPSKKIIDKLGKNMEKYL